MRALSPTLSRSRLEAAKVATAVVFALNGATFATWASRIPDVRNALGLTPGQLGILMLFGAAGSLVGLPVAGPLTARVGTRPVTLIGVALGLVGLLCVGLSVDGLGAVVPAAASLFFVTMGIGLWDVAMNLEGTLVEQGLERNIMPRFHAGFSLGTVISALIGAGVVAAGIPVLVHFVGAVLVVAVAVVVASRAFLPHEVEAAAAQAVDADETADREAPVAATRSAWTEPRTLVIGLIMLVAAFTEGTANDWISVAFVDGYHLPAWAGVLGFATFLTFMTVGRVLGTNLLDRYDRVLVLRVTFVLAGIGSLMVVFGTAPVAYVGAAIWGFGASLGFPVGMSAAADEPHRAAARVSVVSTLAYAAFLVGPPALGFLGDHWGILRALVVVSVMTLGALLLMPAMRPIGPAVAAEAPAADAGAQR